jgi:hypothetical protein
MNPLAEHFPRWGLTESRIAGGRLPFLCGTRRSILVKPSRTATERVNVPAPWAGAAPARNMAPAATHAAPAPIRAFLGIARA